MPKNKPSMKQRVMKKPDFRPRRGPTNSTPKIVSFFTDRWYAFKHYSLRKKITVIAVPTSLVLLIIPIFTYLYFVRDIADAERLMNRSRTGIVINDRNGETIYRFGKNGDLQNATLDQIADPLEQALIASEDKDFYNHRGFSPRSIAGALVANVSNADLTRYGGSTITQQLVKNNLLTEDKNFLRKYQELAIAVAVERHYEKDTILEMYLNSVYYGEGAFGINQAAETFFDKSAADLTLAESSMLIGLLPAPSLFSPISGDPELAKEQQARVLERMVSNEFISEEEAETATAEELVYNASPLGEQEYAHHFTQMVVNELREEYGEERFARSGFTIQTTLDSSWQREAETAVAEQITRLTSQGATNGALVAVDPKTGEIRALVGSADWDNEEFGQINMATSPRQPGSTFKPIYYAEAIDKQLITAATLIDDKPTTYGDYTPLNFDRRFRGDTTVRSALATSLNIPAVEVLQKIGVRETTEVAQRMGISTVNQPETYGLSLALGTAETRLTDMTHAYAAFANEGLLANSTSIAQIEDKFGNTIFRSNTQVERVQSREASFIMSSILSDARARAPLFGNSLTIGNKSVAVKTGTTNDNKDAWAIGYTPSLAVGVWVGDSQNRPMSVGGGAAAGPIWRRAMNFMLADIPDQQFPKPGSIVDVDICSVNGNYREFFLRGTEPDNACVPAREEEPEEEAPVTEPVEQPAQRPVTPAPVEEPEQEDDETTQPDPEPGPESGEGSNPPSQPPLITNPLGN